MISGIIGFILGAFLILVLRFIIPAKKVKKLNQELEIKENQQLDKINNLKLEIKNYEIESLNAKNEFALIQQQKGALENEVVATSQNIQLNYELLEEKLKQKMAESIEYAAENYEKKIGELDTEFSNAKKNYVEEYQKVIKDLLVDYSSLTQAKELEIENLTSIISELQSKVDAATEINKTAELERTEKDYYRIVISEDDIEEIKKLRTVERSLRDKEPLNKVIWKVYYEKPTTDMIGRVIGKTVKTGIYKITNLENGMCYVGQARDLASRWKQHIKRGIGAETPTNNKLYPTMMQLGVENFTFEIIEECPINKLDAQEDYWQDFYHAKDFGYSIK